MRVYFKLFICVIVFFFFVFALCLFVWFKWSLHVYIDAITPVSVECEKHELTRERVLFCLCRVFT